MNKTKLTYPPLTPDDIRTLKGEPMVKIIPAPKGTKDSTEWVYLSPQTRQEEHYIFRNNRLAGWAKTAI